MTVFFVSLDPKESLVRMLDLRLVAHPRRSWKQHITLQYVKESEQQNFGTRSDDDLISADIEPKSLGVEVSN
jgi:hypothetical protein